MTTLSLGRLKMVNLSDPCRPTGCEHHHLWTYCFQSCSTTLAMVFAARYSLHHRSRTSARRGYQQRYSSAARVRVRECVGGARDRKCAIEHYPCTIEASFSIACQRRHGDDLPIAHRRERDRRPEPRAIRHSTDHSLHGTSDVPRSEVCIGRSSPRREAPRRSVWRG